MVAHLPFECIESRQCLHRSDDAATEREEHRNRKRTERAADRGQLRECAIVLLLSLLLHVGAVFELRKPALRVVGCVVTSLRVVRR